MDVRPLTVDDACDVERFEVMFHPRGWEQAVETVVRELLPDHLRNGTMRALGGFIDDRLVALSAWLPAADRADTWMNNPTAVCIGLRRRGYGRIIKTAVLDQALLEGVRHVVSTVHRDNVGMLKINEQLGARLSELGDARREYLACVIDIR